VRGPQVVRGEQPDLVERGGGVQVRAHGVPRPALGGAGPHEQGPGALAVRVAVQRALGGLGGAGGVGAEQRPGERLVRAAAGGLQPLGLGLDLGQVGLAAERGSSPQRERLLEQRHGVGGGVRPAPGRRGAGRGADGAVEPVGVEVLRVEPVPAGDGAEVGADQRPDAGGVAVQRVLGARRGSLRPQRGDEALARDQRAAVGQQHRQQRALT